MHILDNQEIYLNNFFNLNKKTKMISFISPALNKARNKFNQIVGDGKSDKKDELFKSMIDKIDRDYLYLSYRMVCEWIENSKKYSYFKFKHEHGKTRKRVYLSIACIIKDEAEYIEEWLDFYLSQGVERFYIFDNDSTDQIKEVLKKYIEKEQVVYIYFPGKKVQLTAYTYAAHLFKNETFWMAFLDADEFMFSPQKRKLNEVLMDYEAYPGVGVNWVGYGTGGHKTKPEGKLIENYFDTFEDENNVFNLRIKSVVQPSEVLMIPSPHYCVYRKRKLAVSEDRNEITNYTMIVPGKGFAFTAVNHRSILRINHYWTKSEEEFLKKCSRGYPDGTINPDFEKGMERFNYPMKRDDSILHI